MQLDNDLFLAKLGETKHRNNWIMTSSRPIVAIPEMEIIMIIMMFYCTYKSLLHQ